MRSDHTMRKQYIPNTLSASRALLSIWLLWANGVWFWVGYGVCGLTDILDGYLARRLHAESQTGAVIDSLADLQFSILCAVRLLPQAHLSKWMWLWIGAITAVKIAALLLAWAHHRQPEFAHATANRITGLLIFLLLPALVQLQWRWLQYLLCIAASCAAVGELVGTGNMEKNEQKQRMEESNNEQKTV